MRKHSGTKTSLLISAALLLLISFSAISPGCHSYNPALYPSYDVLNPGLEVRINPLGFTAVDPATGAVSIEWASAAEGTDKENLAVVNQAFILWVYELKEEVKKLRGELGKR